MSLFSSITTVARALGNAQATCKCVGYVAGDRDVPAPKRTVVDVVIERNR